LKLILSNYESFVLISKAPELVRTSEVFGSLFLFLAFAESKVYFLSVPPT
jgi:hypothetical protein